MKRQYGVGSLVMCLIFLSGCGSSTEIVKSVGPIDTSKFVGAKFTVGEVISEGTERVVPEYFKGALKESLTQELTKRGGLAPLNSKDYFSVNVVIYYYRMRSASMRFWFGGMAGKDGVESRVTVIDPLTQQALRESHVSTYNVTAVGGPDLIFEMHAEEIADFLVDKVEDEDDD